MRKASIICSILLSLFFLTEPVNAQSINLTPKWTAQAQFAGYYVADKLGFYKEEGLDVHVVHPSLSASSFSFLQKGYSQAVVMNLSYALTEYFAGAQVVNILQTSQENSLMLVSRSPLKGISSLQHKKIGVWNHLSQELLDQIANKYQLQVEWIRFNGGVNIFLSKAVDICLVGSYNEFLQLIEAGVKTDSIHIMHFSDYGYNLARGWALCYQRILSEISSSSTETSPCQHTWVGMGKRTPRTNIGHYNGTSASTQHRNQQISPA